MYTLIYSKTVLKDLKKVDKQLQKNIYNWIDKNLQNCINSREKGKALSYNRVGQWRYRIGNYRLICEIKDKELIILALEFGHRKNIYK